MNLYHYTNFEGLKGILDSQELWLSNRKCVNDTSEFIHSAYLIKNWAKTIIKRQIEGRITSRFMPYLETLLEEGSDMISEALIGATDPAYIFSTCRHEQENDDGILSMWRGYAGSGYAIGLNKERLNNFFEKDLPKTVDNLATVWGEVFYDREDSLPEALKKYQAPIQQLMGKNLIPYLLFGKKKKKISKEQIEAVLELITRFKHDGFREENEYRFTIFGVNHSKLSTGIRNYKNRIVEYCKIPFDPEIIDKIIIGPQFKQEFTKEFIEGYIANKKFPHEIEVCLSGIPFQDF